ncbi:hypothetical protein G3I60_30390 [Streptomyces sp. SID13666]|uniref:hypothetical protein n=1 Tax=unclassified Streptomyces TaxID=2593676 RepID=UPI0013C1D2CA|nr:MULTISPECIES: hypothetical protein [unclassified Streptomyces]NEA58346.1 hypothetical protein [Streptomyces sp. SID13666]NEA69170.1 hypothetical protein [Streptomyces sp. SID13588]
MSPNRNPLDADAMVRTAQTAVRSRSTPLVDAMLCARQARALAKAHDAPGCYAPSTPPKTTSTRALAVLSMEVGDSDHGWVILYE